MNKNVRFNIPVNNKEKDNSIPTIGIVINKNEQENKNENKKEEEKNSEEKKDNTKNDSNSNDKGKEKLTKKIK